MKRTTLTIALLVFASAAQAGDIAVEHWGAGQQKALNTTPDLRAQAKHLLQKLLPNADLITPTVGEAYFANLEKNSDIELLATVDYSGRGFFNTVVVVSQHQGRLEWTEVKSNSRSIENLKSHLVDVNGDGVPELVLQRYIDRYEGAHRVPEETVIYRWQGQGSHGFKDDSDSFPMYYRTHIVRPLQKKLAQALAKPSTSRAKDDYDAFAIKAELARAKHRAGMK